MEGRGTVVAPAQVHAHAPNLLSLLNGTFAQVDINKKKATNCHCNRQYDLRLADSNRKVAFVAKIFHLFP